MSKENNLEDHIKLVQEKKKILKEVVDRYFPGLFGTLMTALSARNILNIDRITLPFILVILGAPGSGKSTVITLISSLPDGYSLDNFTPKSIVSHYGAKQSDLEKNDILPKIKDKAFLTPDLAPLFSARDDNLIEIIGIITRLADGQGYKSSSGIHGERGYGKTFFVWLGAAVDISNNIWDMISRLGPKMFFLKIDKKISFEDEQQMILDHMDNTDYYQQIEKVSAHLKEYWNVVMSHPCQKDGKIIWYNKSDSYIAKLKIVQFSQLLARLRGYVPKERTKNTYGSGYSYGDPIIEDPERATHYLYNLVRGYALCNGRNYIIENDVSIIESIVFSSSQKETSEMVRLLIKNKGKLTASEICKCKSVSKNTALRIMKKLTILGLVNEVKISGTTRDNMGIRLKMEFGWLLKITR